MKWSPAKSVGVETNTFIYRLGFVNRLRYKKKGAKTDGAVSSPESSTPFHYLVALARRYHDH